MSNVISLTDGTTTVTLTSGDYMVTRYAPQSPTPRQTAIDAHSGDQGLASFDWNDVTETLDVFISSSSVANAQTAARAIQTLLETGRRRQETGMGARLYLVVQLAGESDAWRSEILSGRLVFANAGDQLTRRKLEASLIFTRRYFWEANSETQLEMTSSETTTPGTTVVLYNNDDASSAATNYINIASAQVSGVLPAPLRLRITNGEASAVGWQDFYITNFVFCNPNGFAPFLLGSAATGGASYSWATNTDNVAWRWALSNARLTDMAGRYYRILLALQDASSDVYFRPEIQATTLQITLYKGKQVLGNTGELFDIGALPIPPGGYNTLGTSLDLVVRVQKVGGGTVIADFAQLTPSGPGLFTKWTQLGFQTPNGEGIEQNGPEGTIYFTDGSRQWPIVRQFGGPICVWPGRQNRLRVLYRTTDWDSGAVGKKMNASAWYRPRRTDI